MNPSGFDIPSGTTVYSFILSKISIIGCVRKKFGADVQHLLRMSPNVPLLPLTFLLAPPAGQSLTYLVKYLMDWHKIQMQILMVVI